MEPEQEVQPLIVPPVATTPVKKTFAQHLKNPKVIAGIVAGLVVIAALTSVALAYRKQAGKSTGCEGNSCNTNEAIVSATPTPTPSATPTPVARKLDGAMVEPGQENIRPLGIMIENHPEARPQAGLAEADWVYEAIAEGGITRFLALYADANTKDVRVGPVRSVRTYYLDYAREYNAFLAHVGGNSDALASIQANGGITDLDQFAIGEPTFKRDFSRNVSTEHTMFSSTGKLWNHITSKKYEQAGGYEPLLFTDEAPEASRGAAQNVSIDFSSASFGVKWAFDPKTNTYARAMAGLAHKDADTGEVITTKNIVLQTVQSVQVTSSGGKVVGKFTLTGSGKVVVLNNGIATVGTWKRSGNERTRYYNADGSEMKLVRGNTWVEVVHPDTVISY